MSNVVTFDEGILAELRAWYRSLTPLEKVGLWTLVAAGATAAVIAMMQPHVQAAVGGALVGLGTKILIPVLTAASGGPPPVSPPPAA